MKSIQTLATNCFCFHSVDVEEAEKARRVGDFKREFAIYKAHLNDLFHNKSQVVLLLKKEEVCGV